MKIDNMNNILKIVVLSLFANSVHANQPNTGIQKHEYDATVHCIKNKDQPEECLTKKGSYETGVRIVKEGGQCFEETHELIDFKKNKVLSMQIDTPSLEQSSRPVPCNGNKNMIVSYRVLNSTGEQITTGQLPTMSGFAALFSSVNKTTYVGKIESNNTTNGQTEMLIPSILETGIRLNVTPELQSDNRIKTVVSARIADLKGKVDNNQVLTLEDDESSTLKVGNYSVEISVHVL